MADSLPPPVGCYRCSLGDDHKAALLGGDEGRSALQEAVAREYLRGVTWRLELREDGTVESVWDVPHAEAMPAIEGRWAAADDGALRLTFPDEPPWEGALTDDGLRFTHPVVGRVDMERS